MKKFAKSILAMALAAVLTIGASPAVFAQESEGNVSRAEFVSMVSEYCDFGTAEMSNFSDVASDSPYYEAVAKAYSAGIVTGYNGMFYPDARVTVQEAAAILCRAYDLETSNAAADKAYADSSDISSWATEYISSLSEKKFLGASGENMLLPKSGITAEKAKNMIENIENNLLQIIGDDGSIKSVSYADVAYEEDGTICICGSFTFRALQAAIPVLWPEKVPEKADIYVEGPYSDGVEEALNEILGEGNYKIGIRAQNNLFYNFTVTDNQSGNKAEITVNTAVYPENFFELKVKVKGKTATAEETKTFQSKRAELAKTLVEGNLSTLFTVK
jgi:hypothetical protein